MEDQPSIPPVQNEPELPLDSVKEVILAVVLKFSEVVQVQNQKIAALEKKVETLSQVKALKTSLNKEINDLFQQVNHIPPVVTPPETSLDEHQKTLNNAKNLLLSKYTKR